MNSNVERNLGEQPIARIMREHNLKAHDLVAASTTPLTPDPEHAVEGAGGAELRRWP